MIVNLLTVVFVALGTAPVFGQDCITGGAMTPPQEATHRDAIRVARFVNNVQVNQAGARSGRYLTQTDLHLAQIARQATGDAFFDQLNFLQGSEVAPGLMLTLYVTQGAYWFMISSVNDRCVPVVFSNQQGVIYNATPIR